MLKYITTQFKHNVYEQEHWTCHPVSRTLNVSSSIKNIERVIYYQEHW